MLPSNVRQNNTSTSYTREYEANEPMSPAKIKEHEPTAVRRQDNTSSSSPSSSSGQNPKERLRRSGMTEGTAGSSETGDRYEQGAGQEQISNELISQLVASSKSHSDRLFISLLQNKKSF